MTKPVYALVGTDLFLQLAKLHDLLGQMPKDVQRIEADGQTAELAAVLDELRSFAMFSSAKVVVVREAGDFLTRYRSSLEQYVEKPSSSGTLILRLASLPANQRISKLIAKVGEVIKCDAPADVPGWIVRQAKDAHKLTIRLDAARLLLEQVGADLGRLDNELAKLALMSDGIADAGAIRLSVAFQREQEMWDMTNEVSAGRVAEAVRRWRQLVHLDSSTEYRAVTWLTMWLEDVRTYLLDPPRFENGWKYKGERLRVFQETARQIGLEGVERLINLLAEVDARSKSGLGEMKDNVERFLMAAGLRK